MKKDRQAEAITLRKQGYSVKQIEQKLGVARSSVSRWVRDIQLTEDQKIILAGNTRKSAFISAEKSKQRANERRAELKKQGFNRVQVDRNFAVVCALYWGEGRKTQQDMSLTNSDPKMIKVFVDWLIESGYELSATIQYHEENSISYEEIMGWWLKNVPSLNVKNFNRPVICKVNRASQKKNVGKLPYGTIGIRAKKSTKLFWTIMGGIDGLCNAELV